MYCTETVGAKAGSIMAAIIIVQKNRNGARAIPIVPYICIESIEKVC